MTPPPHSVRASSVEEIHLYTWRLNLLACYWWWGNRSARRKLTQTQEEHANSTQKGPSPSGNRTRDLAVIARRAAAGPLKPSGAEPSRSQPEEPAALLNSQWDCSLVVLAVVMVGTLQGDGSQTQALQDLLAHYGENGTISVPQLRALLALLSKSPEHHPIPGTQGPGTQGPGTQAPSTQTPASQPPANSSTCLSTDTLAVFNISERSHLDGPRFQKLCPTMLQQLGSGSCRGLREDSPGTENSPGPQTERFGAMGSCV
ncbi:hypothetical protein WMY93_012897 [Mugilogobius chulae]|uniref:Uncharacterized protein n=1 Tax=Mugilogobius chulae TaxID=88201 RepID=A0AAW0P4X9_9GOBI